MKKPKQSDVPTGHSVRIRPNRFGRLLWGCDEWEASIEESGTDPALIVSRNGTSEAFSLADITGFEIRNRFLSAAILISAGSSRDVVLAGVWRWRTKDNVARLEEAILAAIKPHVEVALGVLTKCKTLVDSFLAQDRYIRHSDVACFATELRHVLDEAGPRATTAVKNPRAIQIENVSRLKDEWKWMLQAAEPRSPRIRDRNEQFMKSEIRDHADFFDSVEKAKLTDEQRRAVVAFEDRNLLVAAAGSGKSSTLIGKAAYAVRRRLFKPDEIIALAFNRKAANELNERINSRIKPWLGGQTIKARTFHSLGYSIVRSVWKAEGRKARRSIESQEIPRLASVLEELSVDPTFAGDWIEFAALCRVPVPDDDAFKSFDEYQSYVDRQREARRQGDPVEFQSLAPNVIVRSAEELAIANWLYLHGVPFRYEKLFVPAPDGWDKFEPDFYYPDIDVWHEHFALNEMGVAPAFFKAGYADQAEAKRRWLTTQVGDRWFETQSAHHRNGSLFAQLKKALEVRGQKFQMKTPEEIRVRVRQIGQPSVLDLILAILHFVKPNRVSEQQFAEIVDRLHDRYRGLQFSKIFWPLLRAYNARLRAEGRVDYDDMIALAAEHLEHKRFSSPYKLIMVDEFQDLSVGRADLVRGLLSQQNRSVLFGVGDDWQAINGFAGSRLDFFMRFEQQFGPTFESDLTKTFRCAQGIADVGGIFVQENSNQKKKPFVSETSPETIGLVRLISVKKNELVADELERLLAELSTSPLVVHAANETGQRPTVFLLGRYGIEKIKGVDATWLRVVQKKFSETLAIEFSTIHKSKGLEADYVFVLGMNGGRGLVFPSRLRSDPLLEMLEARDSEYPNAEERRLFYVAITRARKAVWLLFLELSPSPFVLELMQRKYGDRVRLNNGSEIVPCERCGIGFLVRRSGPYGPFLGCTGYAREGLKCDNKRRLVQTA